MSPEPATWEDMSKGKGGNSKLKWSSSSVTATAGGTNLPIGTNALEAEVAKAAPAATIALALGVDWI